MGLPQQFRFFIGKMEKKNELLVLLVGDFPQPPNLSLSNVSTHTQHPSLSIITTGYTATIIPKLNNNNNNNKDATVSISLGLSKCFIELDPRHARLNSGVCHPRPTSFHTRVRVRKQVNTRHNNRHTSRYISKIFHMHISGSERCIA